MIACVAALFLTEFQAVAIRRVNLGREGIVKKVICPVDLGIVKDNRGLPKQPGYLRRAGTIVGHTQIGREFSCKSPQAKIPHEKLEDGTEYTPTFTADGMVGDV
jgi:hypothetical protein